ncbi:hypothetical protein LJC18_04145 [Lachnospiraceae bacterium OttesenSCG-928-E19]|nr:hypothetical protein [Lachnospiraceae bacterium OttesenSCG-928-E19]
MHKFLKSFGVSLLGMIVVLSADAVQSGRGTATGRATNTSVSGRMPTMPTLPGSSIGNISTHIPSTNDGGNKPTDPDCTPGDPCKCANGATGTYRPDCSCDCTVKPEPECPDGGVKNSKYTVEMCMNDLLSCVNNGGLPGGLNDMFDENVRNSIVNGMNLCYLQVDKCIRDVRVDCKNVYLSPADVWIDFNSRKVQPEYYSFILRKTGLTPNQAENTCWLLDRNTYGNSFTAVSVSDTVTQEYNQKIGAFNMNNNGTLTKKNPQGVKVNTGHAGVDGSRGHYARWDAKTGECLIRVAAYNKDKHITNSWLFGWVGDDRPAEVWQNAGTSFKCGKDLFEFGLMKNTNTVAVVGIGGGTLVGTGIGAIAGHGNRDFDCERDSHRKELTKQLRSAGNTAILNEYLAMSISSTGPDLSIPQCNSIVELYDVYVQAASVDKTCSGKTTVTDDHMIDTTRKHAVVTSEMIGTDSDGSNFFNSSDKKRYKLTSAEVAKIKENGEAEIDLNINVTEESKTTVNDGTKCFNPINLARLNGSAIYCTAQEGCISGQELSREVARLGNVMESLVILRGEKSNMAKSMLIGAGVGAGTGGLATAITAFVEKNNINCRVGDGLDQVGYGKSGTLGTLKDYYVKWNLRLPDTIMPTAMVVDCGSWRDACNTMHDYTDCTKAAINYRPADAKSTKLINAACTLSGSVCIENYPVAVSNGACPE